MQAVLFVLLGMLTAAIGEWQFSVFLRNDPGNFLGSLVFNAIYMSGVYLLTRLALPFIKQQARGILLYTLFFGTSGLMVEWFLIGNSPWGNPNANQLGMFSYWACMALVPLTVLLHRQEQRGFIGRYASIYGIITLAGQALIQSPDLRFAFHIYLVIIGYTGLMCALAWKHLSHGAQANG